MGKNYYPQAFLEECKYVVKNKMTKFINDELEVSSDDSDQEVCDDEQKTLKYCDSVLDN